MMSEWTDAWWQRKLRYRRWPHFKWSNGWHVWSRGQLVTENGEWRRWVCDRCGGTLLTRPVDHRPLLHRGDKVSEGSQ